MIELVCFSLYFSNISLHTCIPPLSINQSHYPEYLGSSSRDTVRSCTHESAHTLHPYSLSVLFSNAASKQQHIILISLPAHTSSLTSLSYSLSLSVGGAAPPSVFFSAPLSKQVAHAHAIDTGRRTAVQHSRTHHRSHSRREAACSMH